MKFFTYGTPELADDLRTGARPLAPGTSWLRFGSTTVFYTDEAPVAAGRGARSDSTQHDMPRSNLHVVVQNGRTFQQEHPDVPVLHDRGRFLLVDLDPETARGLAEHAETCFSISPVEDDEVIFESRTAAPRDVVSGVAKLVDGVTRDRFEADVTTLVAFGTRHSTSDGFVRAATFARAELDGLGYATQLQQFAVGGQPTHNVIADLPGHGGDEHGVVIVTAHLDSVNMQGPAAPAPGADDNGSGSAGVLELARVFAGHAGRHDLRFILFGGEEQGLFGSKHYVATLTAAERARIRCVVNMDMIACLNSPTRSVLLEGGTVSQAAIDGLSEAAATYTDLSVEVNLNPAARDHVPFILAGLPAVLTIEGADSTNHNVHSANDTVATLDFGLGVEILRMNAAFVAEQLGIAE